MAAHAAPPRPQVYYEEDDNASVYSASEVRAGGGGRGPPRRWLNAAGQSEDEAAGSDGGSGEAAELVDPRVAIKAKCEKHCPKEAAMLEGACGARWFGGRPLDVCAAAD